MTSRSTPTSPASPTGSPATPASKLVDALVQTSFMTMAVLNKVGSEHDLSLTQLRVLAILRDHRLRMSDLAAYLGLEKSTMSGLVNRAVQRGLLDRGPSPEDGRAVDVFLSAAGAELADRLYVEIETSLAPMINRVPALDQRRLHELLHGFLAR